MDKIARVRQEIERRINELDKDKYINIDAKACRVSELSFLKRFLDTLSEEPDKSLEEAAYKYSFDSRPSIYGQVDVIDAFKAGAEWQASQMPMPEDTVLFNKGVAEGRRLEREDMLKDAVETTVTTNLANRPAIYLDQLHGFEYGDKVRIVVLKAEEE